MTAYGLGIDAGGTYTDTVVVDLGSGKVVCGNKALTTREDLSKGIRESLLGLDADILPQVSLASLSSTLATNSVVEGKGCRVGLLCIGKEYGRKGEPDCYAYADGRFSMGGREEVPLDVRSIKSALEEMKGRIDALAISGYVSVRNPSHEERAARMAERILGVPVVLGHELTSRLGFDQRTATAVMNARLIPAIRELLESVKAVMADLGLRCPLMMVKGDGALMKDSTALRKPVETILSGPASSMIGAMALTGMRDAMVIDMGGTTSDIGVLRNGRPRIEPEGACIAGRRTRVMAADIATFGIGGDSRILVNGDELLLSPVRAIPLCIASSRWPSVKRAVMSLAEEDARAPADRCDIEDMVQDTEFLMLSSPKDRGMLAEEDEKLLELLEDGPMRLRDAAKKLGVNVHSFSVGELEGRGFVTRIGVTPTDLLHASGRYTRYDADASRVAVDYLARRCGTSVEDFIATTEDLIVRKIAGCAMEKALLDDTGKDAPDPYQSRLIDEVLHGDSSDYKVSFSLKLPIIGIGAPVGAWLPQVAEILGTEIVIPEMSGIGNAIGSITGSVSETVEITVRACEEGPDPEPECDVFTKDGIRSFMRPEEALRFALDEASRIAVEAANANGCANPVVETRIEETRADISPEISAFRKAIVIARATGKPDLRSLDDDLLERCCGILAVEAEAPQEDPPLHRAEVPALPDLRQSLGGALLQDLPLGGTGPLQLQDDVGTVRTIGSHDDVSPAVAALLLQGHGVPPEAGHGGGSDDELVVGLLRQEDERDVLVEYAIEGLLNSLYISVLQTREEVHEGELRIGVDPPEHHGCEHAPHLDVRDGELVPSSGGHGLQISGNDHDRVDRAPVRQELPHRHGRIQDSPDGHAVGEVVQIPDHLRVGMVHQGADDLVPAGARPVRGGPEPVLDVVEEAPGVVDLRISEAVSVIPLLRFLESLRMPVFGAQVKDLLWSESEPLVRHDGEDVVHLEIVHAGEYGLLGDLHHTCHNSELEILVPLERARV